MDVLENANLTVFAPSDSAFAALEPAMRNYLFLPESKADLALILSYHIVPDDVLWTPLIPNGTSEVPTMTGYDITVDKSSINGNITLNDRAHVSAPNYLGSNGVVHVIDAVLLPPTFIFDLRRALIGTNATAFLAALDTADLSYLLNDAGPYTVFAPTNAAVVAAGNLTADKTRLRYHFAFGNIFTTNMFNGQLLPTIVSLPTLQGRFQSVKVFTSLH
jgi:uncharacterized surface protein with fasciclin (FAS1) repeats